MVRRYVFVILALFLLAMIPVEAQSPDPVELTWTASTSTDILAGYNLYRSETPGEGYIQINVDLITGESYIDNNLEWNKVYYYVCRAVSVFGVESTNSNEAVWTVETPPAPEPPNNLQVGGQ